eukprot:1147901-Pelagomonas_calceolata.AAC.11
MRMHAQACALASLVAGAFSGALMTCAVGVGERGPPVPPSPRSAQPVLSGVHEHAPERPSKHASGHAGVSSPPAFASLLTVPAASGRSGEALKAAACCAASVLLEGAPWDAACSAAC